MIHKDLVSEWRSRRAWPAMILLGIVVAVVFSVQMDLPSEYKRQMAASLLWVAIFLAAALGLDRSFALEREDGCWQALLLYPVSPSAIYLAKLAVNIVWLAALAVRAHPAVRRAGRRAAAGSPLGHALGGPAGKRRHRLGRHVAERLGHAGPQGREPDGAAGAAHGDTRGARRRRGHAAAGRRPARSAPGGTGTGCWPPLPPSS